MKLGFRSCIIVHYKYKIINLCSKLSLYMSGLNGDSRSKILSAISSIFAFWVIYSEYKILLQFNLSDSVCLAVDSSVFQNVYLLIWKYW